MSTILLISTIVLIVLIVGGGIYFFSWYRALGELRDKQAHLNYADAIAAFEEAGHPKFEVTLDIVESVPSLKADGKLILTRLQPELPRKGLYPSTWIILQMVYLWSSLRVVKMLL